MRVLILGGTTEGYALAAALDAAPGVRPVSSLAGRTAHPRLPAGEARIGGFGGPAGLARYLRAAGIAAVVDATHPFARRMGWNAAAVCVETGTPLLRLERPAWRPGPGDRWDMVPDWAGAAARVGAAARHAFLAIGRQEIAAFAGLDHIRFLIRAVDPPDPVPRFASCEVLLARGPFAEADELALMRSRGIDTLVCKNSGGAATDGKLAAARQLGVRVVMHDRPPRPALPSVPDVAGAIAWVQALGYHRGV